MVLAPEHPLVETLTAPARSGRGRGVRRRRRAATDRDRAAVDRPREDRRRRSARTRSTRSTASASRSSSRTTCWRTYGTGAIMAVPAHDERDFAFAQRVRAAHPSSVAMPEATADARRRRSCRRRVRRHVATDDEVMVNSGQVHGWPAPEGCTTIVHWLEERGQGKATVTYRLRDWLISRQRYWGTPIPVIYCTGLRHRAGARGPAAGAAARRRRLPGLAATTR